LRRARLLEGSLQLDLAAASQIGLLAQIDLAPGLLLSLGALGQKPAGGGKPLQALGLTAQNFIGLGLFGLAAGVAALPLDLAEHVIEPVEVFLDPLQLALAHLAPALE